MRSMMFGSTPSGIMAIAAAMMLTGSPVLASIPVAPLPNGVVASANARITGLYAEQRFGRIDVNEDLDRLTADCDRRGVALRVEGRDLQWAGKRRLYRTGENIAVFEENPEITTDEASCTARISLRSSVTLSSASDENLVSSGWFSQPAACAPPGRGTLLSRCDGAIIVGIRAMCVNLGDQFVGSTDCYSAQDDLSRGLMLSHAAYSDDGSGPDNGWELSVVMTESQIDPAIFRQDR